MNILKNISARLQKVNENFGQLKAEMIDTEIIRETNLELWRQGQNKDLESETDNNGTFKVKFDGI